MFADLQGQRHQRQWRDLFQHPAAQTAMVVAIYNGSINGNTARIDLPEDGDYTIRVYLMGNDRDTGKTVGYNLDLSIQ